MTAIGRIFSNYERLLLLSRLFCAVMIPVFAYNGQAHRPNALMLTAFAYYFLSTLFLSFYGRNKPDKSWRPWQVFVMVDLLLVTCMVRDHGGLQSDIYYYYYEAMAMSAFLFKWKPALLFTFSAHLLYLIAIFTTPGQFNRETLLLRLTVFFAISFAFPVLSFIEQERVRSVLESTQLLNEKIRLLEEMETNNRQVAEYTLNLQNQAVLDPLTQLHNPTYFHKRLMVEIEKSRQSGHPLSLVLFDIDNFKRVNDTFGHLVGDEVLIAIAKQLRDMLADTFHVPTRLGGEELAVLMTDTGLDGAYRMAEALRGAISQVMIPLPNGGLLSVTCSVGVATFPLMCDNHQQLIDFADQAMYIAKSSGKNRTCLYKSTHSAS